jgi:hypothetical protein
MILYEMQRVEGSGYGYGLADLHMCQLFLYVAYHRERGSRVNSIKVRHKW